MRAAPAGCLLLMLRPGPLKNCTVGVGWGRGRNVEIILAFGRVSTLGMWAQAGPSPPVVRVQPQLAWGGG